VDSPKNLFMEHPDQKRPIFRIFIAGALDLSGSAKQWQPKILLRDGSSIPVPLDLLTRRSPLSFARSNPGNPSLARQRSEWVYKMLAGQYLNSISLHPEGPSDNTLRRYMRGIKSNRDGSVRGQLAKVFDCDIGDVPL
jgi:hypothetical protein